MSKLPTEHIVYVDRDHHWPASHWLEENQIIFMSFSVDWRMIDKPYAYTGFCFLNKDDSLMFALRWA